MLHARSYQTGSRQGIVFFDLSLGQSSHKWTTFCGKHLHFRVDVAFGDKKHGDTIKKSIPQLIAIFNRIGDSYLMGELQAILT